MILGREEERYTHRERERERERERNEEGVKRIREKQETEGEIA